MDLNMLQLLLLTIKNSKSSVGIQKAHISNIEIGDICSYALENGFIEDSYGKYKITEKGIQKIAEINLSLNRTGIEKFIATYSGFKIPKLSLNDIYIPENFL